MLADLWVGNTETAEVFFVVAIVLFIIGSFVHFAKNPNFSALWFTVVPLGLVFLALAFLVL